MVPVVSPILVVWPSHIVCAVGVKITVEIGFTVTSRLKGTPGQSVGFGPVGVMVYLITPGDVPELTSVLLIVEPQPEEQFE